MSNHTSKWFTLIPMHYTEDKSWWQRDAGLTCLGFRELGIDSRFVLFPKIKDDGIGIGEKPIITATLEQMMDPIWWAQWKLDGVVINSWALPRYEPIARAIKLNGIKLAIRLDSDGDRSPRVSFYRYLHVKYRATQERGRLFPFAVALAKTLIAWFFPMRFGIGTIRHLRHGDVFLIESPLAKQRYGRFLKSCQADELVERLVSAPDPVTRDMVYDPQVPKQKLIVAVGRWGAVQKDSPRLVAVLGFVLQQNRDYRARIIGSGREVIEKLVQDLPSDVQSRIEVTGPVDHDQLPEHYRSAQIYLCTSHWESFCIAAAEALCCGCSVVGPAKIPSMVYFTSAPQSGTVAATRSLADLEDAVLAEIGAWVGEERIPEEISKLWCKRLHPRQVASLILRSFSETHDDPGISKA